MVRERNPRPTDLIEAVQKSDSNPVRPGENYDNGYGLSLSIRNTPFARFYPVNGEQVFVPEGLRIAVVSFMPRVQGTVMSEFVGSNDPRDKHHIHKQKQKLEVLVSACKSIVQFTHDANAMESRGETFPHVLYSRTNYEIVPLARRLGLYAFEDRNDRGEVTQIGVIGATTTVRARAAAIAENKRILSHLEWSLQRLR